MKIFMACLRAFSSGRPLRHAHKDARATSPGLRSEEENYACGACRNFFTSSSRTFHGLKLAWRRESQWLFTAM